MTYNLILLSYYTFLILLAKKNVQNIFFITAHKQGSFKNKCMQRINAFAERL